MTIHIYTHVLSYHIIVTYTSLCVLGYDILSYSIIVYIKQLLTILESYAYII